jgi:hypothetical protein
VPEGVKGDVDDLGRAIPRRRGSGGNRVPTRGADLRGNGFRIGAGAGSDVVHDHCGSFATEEQRMFAPDAPTRPGDHGHSAIESTHRPFS